VLVETAARALEAHFPPPERPQILDIGTGCGCIAICLTILRPECRMTALDVSERALGVARQNAVSLGARGICFKKSDLFSAFGKRHKGYWDLIVSNPPYIPGPEIAGLSREVRSEPRVALDGGREGLDLILAILDRAPYFLKPGGFLLLEIGKGQAAALGRRLKRDARWARHEFLKDYPGVRRVLRARAA
jgi:release factor glutamine methyltransferase